VAPSDDLLLYLPLDSSTTNLGSGTYTMNLSGASYVTTQCGSGLEFDGDNDYLEISPSMETVMDDDFTITAWIKLNSQTEKMGIFSIRDQCSSTYRGFSMAHLNFGEYNVPGFNYQVNQTQVCNTGSGGDRYNNPLISIVNNEETFVAVSVLNNSSANRVIKLYVNCEEFTSIQTIDMFTDDVFNSSHDFITTIGASSTTSGFYNTIDGTIDEFRIYTTVLDHEEIMDVYQSCLPLEMNIENYTSCEGDSAIITLYNTEIDVEYQLMDITNNQLISPLLNGDCNELQFYTGLITNTTSFEIIAENQISNCSIVLDSVITIYPTVQSFTSEETIYSCEGDSILIDGTYYYSPITLSDTIPIAGNCDSILITYLLFNPIPLVDIGSDTTLCEGETLVLNAGSANLNYLWQDNSTLSTFIVSEIGFYWVEVNDNGCFSSDSINIDYIPAPYVDIGNDSFLCDGESILLDATTPNVTYLWQDNSTEATYYVDQEGLYHVSITEDNCTYTDSIIITYPSYPPVNLGPDVSMCDGDLLILSTGSTDLIYLWQDNSSEPTLNVTQTGIYWVGVSENGCASRDTINVVFNSVPFVNLGNDTSLCEGESILLDATTPNVTYLWQNNSVNSTFLVNNEGVYWVEVSDNNCSYRDTINISYIYSSELNLGEDAIVCIGDKLTLDATITNGNYIWHDNSTNPTYIVDGPGVYSVNAYNNCHSLFDSIEVTYIDCDCNIYMPNAFTPSGDGRNDFYGAVSDCSYDEFHLLIFNRWGEVVFESFDIQQHWNGAINEYYCPSGVYSYVLQYKNWNKGLEGEITGVVTLLR